MLKFKSFLSLVLFAALAGFAQTEKVDMKALVAKYPDDKCIGLSSEEKYTFKVKTENKKEVFTVQESTKSSYFTGRTSYGKSFYIVYDASSTVDNIVCRKNGNPLTNVTKIYTNYEKEEVFHDDIKLCAFKIEMLKEIPYSVSYEKTFQDPRLITKIYFHESAPMKSKSIIFEIPDWVEVGFDAFNFEGANIKKTETQVTPKLKQVKFEATDLEAIPEESHSPNAAKYLPHIMVYVKSYKTPKSSAQYFSTHADIYTWCKALADSANAEKDTVIINKAKEIVQGTTDSLKKVEKIFYWVQDHVRYIAFEDGIMGYKPMTPTKVYNMLYGDCKGMANLTRAMLRALGFDARLVWIGTTDIPYDNNLPSLAVYNHMICSVVLGGKRYFLDATEDFIALGDYAERIQGRPVMVEGTPGNYINDKIPFFAAERNKMEQVIDYNLSGKTLKGKCSYTIQGEQKTVFIRGVANFKTENKDHAIRNYLRSGNANLNITKYTTTDLSERDKPLLISYEFDLENSVYSAANKEMVVYPEKDNEFENLQFDSTRKNDYEFNNRYYVSTTANFHMPAGYSMKYAPTPLAIKTPDYEISVKYENAGSVIKLQKVIIIRNSLLKKKKFDEWNKNIAALKKFYHEPLILKS